MPTLSINGRRTNKPGPSDDEELPAGEGLDRDASSPVGFVALSSPPPLIVPPVSPSFPSQTVTEPLLSLRNAHIHTTI